MTKSIVIALAIGLISASAFAVDGVVVINQSTVMTAGGFPYAITQPGSYKLSGNLTLNTTQAGDFLGGDIAIFIGASNVTLDLNGFTIVVNDAIGDPTHQIYAISELGAFSAIRILNGNIKVTSPKTSSNGANLHGISLKSSHHITLKDLVVIAHPTSFGFPGDFAVGITSGPGSLLNRIVVDSDLFVDTPCLVENSVAKAPPGCTSVNNTDNTLTIIP